MQKYRFPALMNTFYLQSSKTQSGFLSKETKTRFFSVVLSDMTVLSGARVLAQNWDL